MAAQDTRADAEREWEDVDQDDIDDRIEDAETEVQDRAQDLKDAQEEFDKYKEILIGGALLFGTLWQLSLNPQLVLPGLLSRYIWRTIPFVITIGVLLIMSTRWFRIRWGAARPEALATPYAKE